jgi:invasion protein IalB
MANGLLRRAMGSRFVVAGAGMIALAGLGVGTAVAQQPKDKSAPATKQAPAAKQAPASKSAPAASAPQSAWVKLCEKTQVPRVGKDGKPLIVIDGKPSYDEKEICLTHHERLDGNTGMVLVSAAIRKVEGQDKQHLMIMVPLGMALPPGIKTAVYTKEQWAKAAKKETIDEKQLQPIDLKYLLCHQGGCTAETEATSQLIDAMKTGGGMMVLALNINGQPVAFPVPLDGFDASYKGPAVDNKAYATARGELMKQIRARQIEMFKQYQEELKKKQEASGAPAEAAPQAPAPTKKK